MPLQVTRTIYADRFSRIGPNFGESYVIPSEGGHPIPYEETRSYDIATMIDINNQQTETIEWYQHLIEGIENMQPLYQTQLIENTMSQIIENALTSNYPTIIGLDFDGDTYTVLGYQV